MEPAAILAAAEARHAEHREWMERNARIEAEMAAQMHLIHMKAMRRNDAFYHWMLYVTFNPKPSPEVAGMLRAQWDAPVQTP